jgi:hypothetical protein
MVADDRPPFAVSGRAVAFGTDPCAQFWAYDSLGAGGKAREALTCSDRLGHKKLHFTADFSIVSLCIYLENIGSGRGT